MTAYRGSGFTAAIQARESVAPWWSLTLLGLCYSGYFKGSPLAPSGSLDLTLAFAAASTLGIVVCILRSKLISSGAAIAILALWFTFASGAVITIAANHNADKVLLLSTVTLLVAIAPCFLLSGGIVPRWWLVSVLAAAVLMSAAAVVFPDAVAQQEFGRLKLEGSSTIGSSRVVGAGIVIAVVLALTAERRRWMWWLGAGAGMLVVMDIGSRGPFLAVLLAISVTLLASRIFRRRRAAHLVVGSIAIGIVLLLVTQSTSRSSARIAEFIAGDVTDRARGFLLASAWHEIVRNPLGVGWGGFGSITQVETVYGGAPIYPHNMFVEILVEGGWLAGIFFAAVVFFSLRGFARGSTTPIGAALFGLAAYWLLVAQTSSDVNGNRMTWAMLGLGVVFWTSARAADRAAASQPLGHEPRSGGGDAAINRMPRA